MLVKNDIDPFMAQFIPRTRIRLQNIGFHSIEDFTKLSEYQFKRRRGIWTVTLKLVKDLLEKNGRCFQKEKGKLLGDVCMEKVCKRRYKKKK